MISRSRLWQLYGNLSRMAPATFMRIADRNAAEVGLDRIVDVVFFDLVELNVVLIDGKAKTRRAITTGHIIVDDEGHLTEDIAQLNRNCASHIGIVAVNLGKQRGDEGGPGGTSNRIFTTLSLGYAEFPPRPHVQRIGAVRWRSPLGANRLQIALLRLTTQIRVPHEAVEIEWSGRPRIGLDARQFW